jgi:hypothetical protein
VVERLVGLASCWLNSVLGAEMRSMKSNSKKRALTFGEFVAALYAAWGKRKALGIVRLAVNAHLVEFRGRERFVISEV